MNQLNEETLASIGSTLIENLEKLIELHAELEEYDIDDSALNNILDFISSILEKNNFEDSE